MNKMNDFATNCTKPSFRYSNLFLPYYFTDRENMIRIAMEYVRSSKLSGDYLEFGVFEGTTFTAAYHFAKREKVDTMHFYAFDSFKGMPSNTESAMFPEGKYVCSQKKFKENLQNNEVDLNNITCIEGWFHETLSNKTKSKLPLSKAAVIWIDCDLYESTVSVLDFIKEYLQDGTILCFDDWFAFFGASDKGELRATREWLQGNTDIHLIEYHTFGKWGKSFLVQMNHE